MPPADWRVSASAVGCGCCSVPFSTACARLVSSVFVISSRAFVKGNAFPNTPITIRPYHFHVLRGYSKGPTTRPQLPCGVSAQCRVDCNARGQCPRVPGCPPSAHTEATFCSPSRHTLENSRGGEGSGVALPVSAAPPVSPTSPGCDSPSQSLWSGSAGSWWFFIRATALLRRVPGSAAATAPLRPRGLSREPRAAPAQALPPRSPLLSLRVDSMVLAEFTWLLGHVGSSLTNLESVQT